MLSDFKIITFNIWDLPGLFLKDRKKRIQNIVLYLKKLDADIICIQESWDKQNRAYIYENIGEKYHAERSRPALMHKVFPFSNKNGGLFTLSKYPIISEKFWAFDRAGYNPSETISKKGMLVSIIKTPKGLIRIINAHLHSTKESFGRQVRIDQLIKMLEYIDKDPHVVTVLAGDFNEPAMMDNKEFANLFVEKNFVHPIVAPLGATAPTYRLENPWTGHWTNDTKYSKRLDYIFIRSFEKLGLLPDSYMPIYLEQPLSDHDPVVLSLSKSDPK